MKTNLFIAIVFVSITLISCDAINYLHYSVINQSNDSICIRHPKFPIEPVMGTTHQTRDTILKIGPNEVVWLGVSPPDIDFPWATKTIYEDAPGICGLELIREDSIVTLDCSSKSWTYKKRGSFILIK